MSMVSSASGATAAKLVINGLVSGITTPEVIDALLEAYQEPITDITEKQSTLGTEASDYRTLSTAFQAVETAAKALSTKSAWDLASATTSDSSVATAVAAAGAQTGSLSFTVTQLAQANVLASSGAVASEGEVVTDASAILVATGAAAIGFSGLTVAGTAGTTGGPALPIGSFTITVTQSSGAATVTGTRLTGAVHVTATATLDLSVDGRTYALHLTLAAGTYEASTIADAITSAASAAGAQVTATASATGALVLATDSQGSAASITVTGSTGLATVGLTDGQSGVGADAVVTVGGTRNTLSSITAGSSVELEGPGGAAISVTVSATAGPSGALISAGSAKAVNVSTGNGSLTDVVSAINASGLSATATAVQLSSGEYILQLSADDTGTVGAVSLDAAAFIGSPLGQVRTITTAHDATVSVGGTDGYTLSSSTDTFTNLLSGTSVTVSSTSKTPVTVTVTPDATGEATRVAALVTAANKALADIQKYAGYTTTSKEGGPLMGDAVVATMKDDILSIFGGTSGTSTLGDLSNIGVTLSKTGTGNLSFTKQAFTAAFAENRTEVEDLFVQGGTYTPSGSATPSYVTFAFAETATDAGTYDVVISQSATQATDVGSTLASGSVSTAQTLTITMGTASATYTTAATQSLTSIASGLNSAFAIAKLDLSAEVVTGKRLEILSDDYGSAATFTVSSTASGTGTTGLGTTAPITYTGTNVAGTIGGVTATGDGQVLSLSAGSRGGGLGIVVTAPDITATESPVALGVIAYRPGVAQQLVSAMNTATTAATGSITTMIKSLTDEATGLNSQLDMYEQLETKQRTVLQNEFDTMETNLGKLEDESSELESEIAKITTTG